jgi:hypothetical protein
VRASLKFIPIVGALLEACSCTGRPTPPCQKDSDCSAAQPVCVINSLSAQSNHCGCGSFSDCPTLSCNGNELCMPCSTEADCPVGFVCNPNGTCGPCEKDSDCAAPQVCEATLGLCGAPCVDDGNCALLFGEYVDTLSYLASRSGRPDSGAFRQSFFGCHPVGDSSLVLACPGTELGFALHCASCVHGCACAPSQSCVAADCTCTRNADCLGGLVCSGGVCASCFEDADCPCGLVCTAGLCVGRCRTDQDCLQLGQEWRRCSPMGHCRSCLSDTDCLPGSRQCFPDGCIAPCTSTSCSLAGGCASSGRCVNCPYQVPGPPPDESVPPCDGGEPDGFLQTPFCVDAGIDADSGASADDGG